MKARLLGAGVLALSLLASSPSQADVDVGIFFSGAAIHGDGFSLYFGGPYGYAPYAYGRPRYAHPHRHSHRHSYRKYAPPRYYSAPKYRHWSGDYDRAPKYRHGDRRPHGYRQDFSRHGSSHRSGAIGDYRGSRLGDRHYGSRQQFFRGDRHHQ
jgi:hypothetical protein